MDNHYLTIKSNLGFYPDFFNPAHCADSAPSDSVGRGTVEDGGGGDSAPLGRGTNGVGGGGK